MADAFRQETERLILRDWREEDWAPFWEGTNTPAVMQWLGGVADEATKASARARLEGYRRVHGHTFWVVERKSDGDVLGFCGLKRCNEEAGPFGMMEVGWRLRKEAWGYGYAKEAARLSLDVGFDRFGADEIIALTVAGNTSSLGLMERLGMVRRRDLDFEDSYWAKPYGTVIAYSIDRLTFRSTG